MAKQGFLIDSKNIALRIDGEQLKLLEKLSKHLRRSQSALMREALENYLSENKGVIENRLTK